MIKLAKLGVFSDSHFSLTSSILTNKSGYKFSARLDYLIKSFKWMYELFEEEGVKAIVHAGDLFDSDIILPEVGSALSEALSYNTSNIPQYFLLGNHEKKDLGVKYNSLSLLSQSSNIEIIDSTKQALFIGDDKHASFLPYTKEMIDMNMTYCYDNHDSIGYNQILFSHVDYLGMKAGAITLDSGISIEDVSDRFKLILNGHIHTASSKGDYGNIVNIGAFTGLSFNDTYTKYYPGVIIVDTESLEIKRVANPYAILFFTFEVKSISELLSKLNSIQVDNPKCVRVKAPYEIRDDIRELLESSVEKYNILTTKIVGKVKNSSVFLEESDSEDIRTYASGYEALITYLDTIEESNLPSPKSEMVEFLNTYMR